MTRSFIRPRSSGRRNGRMLTGRCYAPPLSSRPRHDHERLDPDMRKRRARGGTAQVGFAQGLLVVVAGIEVQYSGNSSHLCAPLSVCVRFVVDDRIVVVGLIEGDQVADAGGVKVSTAGPSPTHGQT